MKSVKQNVSLAPTHIEKMRCKKGDNKQRLSVIFCCQAPLLPREALLPAPSLLSGTCLSLMTHMLKSFCAEPYGMHCLLEEDSLKKLIVSLISCKQLLALCA